MAGTERMSQFADVRLSRKGGDEHMFLFRESNPMMSVVVFLVCLSFLLGAVNDDLYAQGAEPIRVRVEEVVSQSLLERFASTEQALADSPLAAAAAMFAQQRFFLFREMASAPGDYVLCYTPAVPGVTIGPGDRFRAMLGDGVAVDAVRALLTDCAEQTALYDTSRRTVRLVGGPKLAREKRTGDIALFLHFPPGSIGKCENILDVSFSHEGG